MLLDNILIIFVSLVVVFTGFLAAYVTVHPTDIPKIRRRYRYIFVALSVVSLTLLVWQGVRNTQATHELNERIDILYKLQATAAPRPTAEEIAALTKRATKLSTQNSHDLRAELRSLSADILQFVAEREAGAPQQAFDYYHGPQVVEMVEMMNRPLDPDKPTFAEVVEWMHRIYERAPVDYSRITPNEQDSEWIERNWPSIAYYYQTRILFGKKFGKRICEVAYGTDCHCGIVDPGWQERIAAVAELRIAERPIYEMYKGALSTGIVPTEKELQVLRQGRDKALVRYWKANTPYKNTDSQTLLQRSLAHASVVSAIAEYPTNLTAMKVLAKEMERVANLIPR